jgi:molybdopterin synthase sulfur carrier subunit
MTPQETIGVKMFGGLEERCGRQRQAGQNAGPGGRPATVPTVAALIAALGLPPTAVGLILINGLHADAGSALTAGDEVALFPPVGGG